MAPAPRSSQKIGFLFRHGVAQIVILNVVVIVAPAAGPNGVCITPCVCRSTFTGAVEDIGVAIVETVPVESETVTVLDNITEVEGTHVTGTFGSRLPFPSSTRAVSRTGSGEPTGPD